VTALAFVHETPPTRVVFEPGGLTRIEAEAARLNLQRMLVLSTPQQSGHAELAASALGARLAGTFSGAAMHTPVEVTDLAFAELRKTQADGLVAIGGGSAIGLAKALALRTDLPQIVVPTTYAGSEATPILGETKEGLKTTQRSLKVLPEVVLYDVELTLSLPVALSVSSGLNAIAHAAEALYAQDSNPLIQVMAEEGARALAAALPRIHAQPDDRAARSEALYGAWLCGTCLGAVGMALHHKICHTLGGAFGLPHAETHAVMLPHALAYNLFSARDAGRRLSRALNGQDPALGLYRLARSLGAPTALRDLGMPQDALEQAADLAVQNPYVNPRPIERSEIRAMLARAWSGDPPTDWGFNVAASRPE
jgi:alcohol dehydrogenase class IV